MATIVTSSTTDAAARHPSHPASPSRAVPAGGSTAGTRTTRPSGRRRGGRSPAATCAGRSSPSTSASASGCCGRSSSSTSDAGIDLTLSELFWLTALPNLVGRTLRIPYTFAVPRFGGRMWTRSARRCCSSRRCCWRRRPERLARRPRHAGSGAAGAPRTAGFGGGNFSSSMANISFFYPEGSKGFALGLNAAGGNLGVAVAQLVVPLVIIVGCRRGGEAAGARRAPRLRGPVDPAHRRSR